MRLPAPVLLSAAALTCGPAAPPVDLARERIELDALTRERDALSARVAELVEQDPRREKMPAGDVLLGIPTPLARDLIERVLTGLVDQVTLVLKDITVRKRDTVKKLVTLGEFDLNVHIQEVRATLKPGTPRIDFGGNRVQVALPITLAEGHGEARVRFRWDGRSVADMVCGDLDVTRQVSGSVEPNTYALEGALTLSAEATEIVASPKFPKLRVKLKVLPSGQSWDAIQQILDEKQGTCGFVLDRVDVRSRIEQIVGRGFYVTLPTEKLKPVRLPASVQQSVSVQGRPLDLAVSLGGLAITEDMLWLGAIVQVNRS